MSADLAYIGSVGTIRRTLDDCFENIVANKHYKKINTISNGDMNDYISEIGKLYTWFKEKLAQDGRDCSEYKNFASMVETLLYDGSSYKKPDVNTPEKALNTLKDLNDKLERDLIYGGFIQLMEDGIDVYNECKRIKSEGIKNNNGIYKNVLDQLTNYWIINSIANIIENYKDYLQEADKYDADNVFKRNNAIDEKIILPIAHLLQRTNIERKDNFGNNWTFGGSSLEIPAEINIVFEDYSSYVDKCILMIPDDLWRLIIKSRWFNEYTSDDHKKNWLYFAFFRDILKDLCNEEISESIPDSITDIDYVIKTLRELKPSDIDERLLLISPVFIENNYNQYAGAFTSTAIEDDGLVNEICQRWADISNLLCGLKHPEDHQLAGRFGCESMELNRIIMEAIQNDFIIDVQNTNGKVDPHEKYSSYYEGLITQLTRLIVVYVNSGLFDISKDKITINSKFSQYTKKGKPINKFLKYTNGDIQNELINKFRSRLYEHNHNVNDLKLIMKNVEKIQAGDREKNRNYKNEIYYTIQNAINRIGKDYDLGDIDNKLVLYKNKYFEDVSEFTMPLFKKLFDNDLFTKFNMKCFAKTELDGLDQQTTLAIDLLIILNGCVSLHILDNKFNPEIEVTVELTEAKDLTNQRISFEPTFASPMFAAIEHEIKIISYAIDQNMHDALMESSFKDFVHELEKLINIQYKGIDDIETYNYNNLSLGESFKLANTIVQHTLIALNAGDYYISDNNKFNILCASVCRIAFILDYYHNGGKLFVNNLIKDSWDGDKLQILSDGTYKTWLHQDLKKILVNILALNDYNITIKRGLLFTIIYINHWLRGDFNVTTFPGFNINNENYIDNISDDGTQHLISEYMKYNDKLNITTPRAIIEEFFDDPLEHGLLLPVKINKAENQRDYPIDYVKFSSGSQFGSFVALSGDEITKNNSVVINPENIKRKLIVDNVNELNNEIYKLNDGEQISSQMILYNENDHYAGLSISYNKDKINENIIVPLANNEDNYLQWFVNEETTNEGI